MQYDAIVVGAGLAGSSAAAHLAARGHTVLLLEKRSFPAHKLCGEFLSVEVQAILGRLGLSDAVRAAGAHPITHTRITAPGAGSFVHPLPGTALGISRYLLDDLLCRRAGQLGAEVHLREPVRAIRGGLASGFTVDTDQGQYTTRVIIGAYGKRSTLDRKLGRLSHRNQSPLVAFKAHFSGPGPGEAVELHAFPDGYCGLSQVENELVNACWITSTRMLRRYGSPEQMIAHCFPANPHLDSRFRSLHRVSERFLAVSQISFAAKGTFDADVCMVGDTAGMIAPLCGDGMAMAMRSAEMAAGLASAYLSGGSTPEQFRRRYARAWRSEFSSRMRLGRIAQAGFSNTTVARCAVQTFHLLPAAATWLVHNTRGEQGTE